MDNNARKARRPRRSPQQWASIVEGWAGSGLSAKEYANQQGVGVDSLWRWAGRVGREGELPAIQTQRGPREPAPAAQRFLEVKVTEPSPPAGRHAVRPAAIEISWPAGPVVRLSGDVPASTIVAVLRAAVEVTQC